MVSTRAEFLGKMARQKGYVLRQDVADLRKKSYMALWQSQTSN